MSETIPVHLERPRFVAIDSSLLIGWAAAVNSGDDETREAAQRVRTAFEQSNWIPTICWHHIEELICHGAEDVAADRIAFLKGLPQVGWIHGDPVSPGSIVELVAAEIQAVLDAGDVHDVPRDAVRHAILRFGSGRQLPIFRHWRELRPYLQNRQIRSQQVASLTQQVDPELERLTIGRFHDAPAEDEASALCKFARQACILGDHLEKRGDRRLRNQRELARGFMNDSFHAFMRAKNASAPLAAMLAEFDLTEDDLDENASVATAGNMAAHRRRVRVGCRRLGVDLDSVWPRLRTLRLPSSWIQDELQFSRLAAAARASGSDVADSYLAAFAPYLDAVVVDKRTFEYMGQVSRRDNEFHKSIGRIVRCPSFESLISVLQAQA